MAILGAKIKDTLKNTVKDVTLAITDTLYDDENSEVRLAGLQILTMPVLKDMSTSDFNSLLPTLVTLLVDPEEDVRIAAIQTFLELAKQDMLREIIKGPLTTFFDTLTSDEPRTRVAALKTIGALAQDRAFSDIVKLGTSQIAACLQDDPDEAVRLAALQSFSQLSPADAFRTAVADAAPKIAELTKMNGSSWSIRLQALETLSIFAQNGTFNEEQQSNEEKQANEPDSTSKISSSISKCLSDDRNVCIAALDSIRTLIDHDPSYARNFTSKITEMIELLQANNSDSEMWAAMLQTLSVIITKEDGVDAVVEAIPTLRPFLTNPKEKELRDGAVAVLVALARLGLPDETISNVLSSCIVPTMMDDNPRVCSTGLDVFAGEHLGIRGHEITENEPRIHEMLTLRDLDVRLSAVHATIALGDLGESEEKQLLAAIKIAWPTIFARINGSISSVTAFEKLGRLAADCVLLVDVLSDEQFTDIVPSIVGAIKDQNRTSIFGLHALLNSKLAANYTFCDGLVQVVPKMATSLLNKKNDTQTLGILENMLKLAQYPKLRSKIQEQVSAVVYVLKDRNPSIRTAGLKVLFKLVQEMSPKQFPDRIKSTMSMLLTLIQDVNTRENSIALTTCLAKDLTC
ncbi:armadillo-type protein [Mycena galopus ATCC 62051]|nr:armadillo-type protein [Mycena galopus ATCC 62051]